MCYLGDGTHLNLAPAITTSIQGKQGTVPSPKMTLFYSMLINPKLDHENISDFFLPKARISVKMYLKIFVTRNGNQRENICKYLSIEPLPSGARGIAVCRLVTAAFYICSPQYIYAYSQIQPNTTKYNQ